MDTPPPTFVIGPPRSGTTLMRDLLGRHPRVVALSEEFHRFHHDLGSFLCRHGEDDHFRLTARDATPQLAADYRAAIDAALEASGRSHFVLKISTLSLQVDYVRALVPEARFIQLVRDGRDAVCSIEDLRRALEREQGRPRLLGPAPDALSLWAAQHFAHPHVRAATSWAYHVTRSFLDLRFAGAASFLRLRYEDVLTRPRESVAAALAFMGLELHADVERALAEVSDRPGGEGALGFSTSEAAGGRRLRRFERELAPELRVAMAPLLARPMALLGYEADPVPSAAELERACRALGLDAALWSERTEREVRWFATHLEAFAPERLLRQEGRPSPRARPLLVDGACVGAHLPLVDGRAGAAHAWVQKQERRHGFADASGLWLAIAPRLDGARSIAELVPAEHLEAALDVCERLHGLGFLGYL